MMNKAVIGVTGYNVSEEEGYGGKLRGNIGQGFSVIGHDYLQCVEQAGGIPIGLPVLSDSDLSIVSSLDAIVLTGGEDIDPRLFKETVDHRMGRICPERDHFELKLIDYALKENKPILAICRGMQLLNVYFGGSLYKDISDKGKVLTHNFENNPRWYCAHSVRLMHPVLRDLYGSDEINVNSYHHMAVNRPGAGLEVAAEASDGIVEAMVHRKFKDILAVQWHPEMMSVKYEEGILPFQWLMQTVKAEREKCYR